jgi:hypothetical protein
LNTELKLEALIALDVSKQSHDPALKEYEYDYGYAATVTVKSTREPVFPENRKTGMTFALVEGGTLQPYDGPNIYSSRMHTHQVFYNHNVPIVDDLTYMLDRVAIQGVFDGNQRRECETCSLTRSIYSLNRETTKP